MSTYERDVSSSNNNQSSTTTLFHHTQYCTLRCSCPFSTSSCLMVASALHSARLFCVSVSSAALRLDRSEDSCPAIASARCSRPRLSSVTCRREGRREGRKEVVSLREGRVEIFACFLLCRGNIALCIAVIKHNPTQSIPSLAKLDPSYPKPNQPNPSRP